MAGHLIDVSIGVEKAVWQTGKEHCLNTPDELIFFQGSFNQWLIYFSSIYTSTSLNVQQ